ncbi:gremlin-1-like [Hydractinia symbiolongicarpus]|uniref:gremlin-1-like n=1 Tax=Hydractinia symbiolongicarpus TaxID=13093 RepID=UPI00254ACEEC|nr:gremlin-1-like [Hydractinia symbiolongicarpus]
MKIDVNKHLKISYMRKVENLLFEIILKYSSFKAELNEKSFPQDCRSYKLKQVIHYPGCINQTITSSACIGQCFTAWSPHIAGVYNNGIQLCRGCLPDEKSLKIVTLHCPGQSSLYKDFEIHLAMSCKCKEIKCKTRAVKFLHDPNRN